MTRWRRRYRPGRCQDCGHHKRVTVIYFWVNAMRYVVCRTCIAPYRGSILTHTDSLERAEREGGRAHA